MAITIVTDYNRGAWGQLTTTLNLPDPPTNPYSFTVTTNCPNQPNIIATLSTTGQPLPAQAAVNYQSNPYSVTFGNLPAGTYTLTVTITCGTDEVIICQNVAIPASGPKSKGKTSKGKQKHKPAKKLVRTSR